MLDLGVAQIKRFSQPMTALRGGFGELLSWGLIEQGLSGTFIELPCYRTEFGLAMEGQIGATRKILAQQSVGVFV